MQQVIVRQSSDVVAPDYRKEFSRQGKKVGSLLCDGGVVHGRETGSWSAAFRRGARMARLCVTI